MIEFPAPSQNRTPNRFAFLAKKQVAIGTAPAESHSPRRWMWHGQDPARTATPLNAPRGNALSERAKKP